MLKNTPTKRWRPVLLSCTSMARGPPWSLTTKITKSTPSPVRRERVTRTVRRIALSYTPPLTHHWSQALLATSDLSPRQAVSIVQAFHQHLMMSSTPLIQMFTFLSRWLVHSNENDRGHRHTAVRRIQLQLWGLHASHVLYITNLTTSKQLGRHPSLGYRSFLFSGGE